MWPLCSPPSRLPAPRFDGREMALELAAPDRLLAELQDDGIGDAAIRPAASAEEEQRRRNVEPKAGTAQRAILLRMAVGENFEGGEDLAEERDRP